ncbi:MAG: hypothetical protein ABSG68_12070 [Thermoguttaceae bacterium]|jgi:hypothetical protein
MPQSFVEENLRFTFDDAWSVSKLDEHAFFKERLMPMQLTRAMDLLGLHRQSALYFIEVKDYRGSAIELKNDEKMCDGDTLFLQVARKAKDSVVCIAGAARVLQDSFWSHCADVLRKPHLRVKVVVWLEFDLGRRGYGRSSAWIAQETRARANNQANLLKKKLTWLTKEVLVTNQALAAWELPGVTVENVARAGHR